MFGYEDVSHGITRVGDILVAEAKYRAVGRPMTDAPIAVAQKTWLALSYYHVGGA